MMSDATENEPQRPRAVPLERQNSPSGAHPAWPGNVGEVPSPSSIDPRTGEGPPPVRGGIEGGPFSSSAAGTVLANLVPAVGVLFFGWDAFTVVFLYWLENAVIGIFNILRMALARSEHATVADMVQASGLRRWTGLGKRVPEQALREWESQPAPKLPAALKFFLVPFFMVHYSMFMLVHFVFIVALLHGDGANRPAFSEIAATDLFNSMFSLSLLMALASLVVEHGYEFYKDYLLGGGYKRTNPAILMFRPYPRIVVMHLAILFGGFLFVFLGLPRLMVVLLVVLKLALELITRSTKLSALAR